MENIATIQTCYSLPASPQENRLAYAIDIAGNNVPLDWKYITTIRNTRHGDGNVTIEYPTPTDSVKSGLPSIAPATLHVSGETVSASPRLSPSAHFDSLPDAGKSDGPCIQPFRISASAPARLESGVCAYCRQPIIR